MGRPRVSEDARVTGMMISMPRPIQEALRRHVEAEVQAGRSASISGIARNLFTWYLGLNPNQSPPVSVTGEVAAPPRAAAPTRIAAPVQAGVQDPDEGLTIAETLAKARKPSQMSREERIERMRKLDPEMYAQHLKDEAARAIEVDSKLKDGF